MPRQDEQVVIRQVRSNLASVLVTVSQADEAIAGGQGSANLEDVPGLIASVASRLARTSVLVAEWLGWYNGALGPVPGQTSFLDEEEG